MQVDAIQVLTESVGEDLAGQFQAIAEQQTGDRPKYDDSVLRQLRRMIVCRNYGRAVLELCHFTAGLGIAAGGQQGMISLIWSMDRATAGGFRHQIMDLYCEDPRIDCRDDMLTLLPAGQSDEFSILYNRMPLLTALMDFVTATTGFDILLDLADSAFAATNSGPAIQQATKDIQAALYTWLKDQLHPGQEQRKYRRIIDYVGKNDIGDQMALDFWRDHALEEDSDFRSFDTVADSFIAFLSARDQVIARRAARHAGRIGTDREEGETDPDEITACLAEWVEDQGPLEALSAAPLDEIKFLTGKAMTALEPLIKTRGQASKLPLTVLRKAGFGKAQRSLTEATRRKERNLEDAITAAIGDNGDGAGDSVDYTGIGTAWRQQATEILRTRHAVAALLISGQRAAGLLTLSELDDGLDLSILENAMQDMMAESANDGVISLAARRAGNTDSPAARLFAQLPRLRQEHASLQQALELAARDLKGIARKGFRPADPGPDDPRLDILEEGNRVLGRLFDNIDSYLRHLPPLDEKFVRDRSIFIDMYRQLYGDSLKGHAE